MSTYHCMHLRRTVFTGGWQGWREAARPLLAAALPPDRVVWVEEGRGDDGPTLELFETGGVRGPSGEVRVPRRFFELGEFVADHRGPDRWAILYRVLWRVVHGGEPKLLEVEVDPDVRRLITMERAVRRAAHKMQAFVRFRATGGENDPYVAWFEPEQPVVERVAPFFARRFAAMRWSILTPDGCAHWDGRELRFTEGMSRSAAPAADALEELWRTYYAHIFNPARLNVRAMQSEMPKVYWKNLPEAELIPRLRSGATSRVRRMVEGTSTSSTEPALRRGSAEDEQR